MSLRYISKLMGPYLFKNHNLNLTMAKIVDIYSAISGGSGGNDFQEHISRACESLQNHNLISIPTDTIYGVAGLAQSTEAVNNIYDLKHRDYHNPISICVGDLENVKKWGKVTVSSSLLAELLPGPVTTVFERTLDLNPDLNRYSTLVGIRIPNYGFVRELARACKEPLALTSANISNSPSTLQIQEFKELWPRLDLVFDGGMLGDNRESRLGSTVVDLSKVGQFTIIREGSAHRQTCATLLKYGLREEKKL